MSRRVEEMPVEAGDFGEWLRAFRASLKGNAGMQVPCGDCTGCCISGYSIQLRPEDRAAREHIPEKLLFRARGFSSGSLVMPPKEDGVCPMLERGQCSIYAHRPQTCLDYDCRVFAAAGIDAGGPDKTVINRRVRAWRFTYATTTDRDLHDAVRRAAAFIRDNRESFGDAPVPASPSGIAVLAVKAHNVILSAKAGINDAGMAAAILATARSFDAEPSDSEIP
jgi:uncharacterized protein